MKILFLFLLLGSPKIWAYPCPQNLSLHKEGQTAYQWMKKIKGQWNLKNCRLEITVCNGQEPSNAQNLIGELYLIDEAGREAYLPVTVMEKPLPKIKTQVKEGRRWFYYFRSDRFYEQDLGRTEAYRLEVRMSRKDPSQLEGLDLGTYSTHHQLNQPNGNDSRWYNCGEE
jgi:hypothetical protein